VEVPGRSLRVHARTAVGEEHADLWRRFVARLDDYRRYAEAAGREIPIVLLEPVQPVEPDTDA
jgi:hypothetical protein